MELIQERVFPFADGDGAQIVAEYLLAGGQVCVEVRVENLSAVKTWERVFVIYREVGAQSVMSAAAQGAADAIIDSYHRDDITHPAWDDRAHDAPENAAYHTAYNHIYIPF